MKYVIFFLMAALLSCTSKPELKSGNRPLKAIICFKPDYPQNALKARQEGDVKVLVTVSENGRVTNTQVTQSSGFPDLDSLAEYGFSKCKFNPEIKDGKPVVSETTLTFSWRLPN